ncbi:MAG: fatty-acyl-CoA synthase [Methylobacteriaceae bacterium]|jgi:fatty-acyl-CoA synthase|nr:fatty-acyl-CoA synthase [Methylobacteriaceae bacterium]
MKLIARLKSEFAYFAGATRAVKMSGAIMKNPNRTFRDIAEELAAKHAGNLALVSDHERFTYSEWNAHSNRYARWLRAQGLRKGDAVALFMPNRPEYICVWTGGAKAGCITALINSNLTGKGLAHSITIADAKVVIVDAELAREFETVRHLIDPNLRVFIHGDVAGGRCSDLPRVDTALAEFPPGNLGSSEREPMTTADKALYIYTSGTTGLPKAANINQSRLLRMMLGFAGAVGSKSTDKMYLALPLYHSTGGICGVGVVLCVGGTCVIREKFSAREFFPDIMRHECTLFVYVGELCRYLLATPPSAADTAHKLRACFGNGLRPDIFDAFRQRFRLPKILEFYGATEGNISLFNFDSTSGAVGRIPKWLERKFSVKIVRFDIEREEPVRGPDGLCIECAPGEAGEILGEILDDPKKPANRFDGYADKAATDKKILRDVFRKGDAWFRSGDLMKKDERGYFYFVDRIGDTFRWKGENVSTTEVAETITTFPGVLEATVYGVQIPGSDGRAGMAAIVPENITFFDLVALRDHLKAHLPDYARPIFLRLQDHLDITGTFKPRKLDLVSDGFDPARTGDPIYVEDKASHGYVRLDAEGYVSLTHGVRRSQRAPN